MRREIFFSRSAVMRMQMTCLFSIHSKAIKLKRLNETINGDSTMCIIKAQRMLDGSTFHSPQPACKLECQLDRVMHGNY